MPDLSPLAYFAVFGLICAIILSVYIPALAAYWIVWVLAGHWPWLMPYATVAQYVVGGWIFIYWLIFIEAMIFQRR